MPTLQLLRIWFAPFLCVACAAVLLVRDSERMADGTLRAHFLDVGQGDATLLLSPSGKQILIDGGPDHSALEGIGRHMSFFDRTIDLLVLTHPDLDHIGALSEVLKRYRVGGVLMSGIQTDKLQYRKFLTLLSAQGIPVILADPQKDLAFSDGLILDVVWPPRDVHGSQTPDTNNTSVVLRALFHSGAILLTGDIEELSERAILRLGADVRSSVLKTAHHGSKTSTSTGFLLAAEPSIAVISVGGGNRFGHPHRSVLDRLSAHGIAILRTDQEGEISLVLR